MAVILHRRPHHLGDISEISQGEVTFPVSVSTLDVTIPATTLNKTLLIFTYNDTSTDTGGQDNENRIYGQLTTTTNIQFKTQNVTSTLKTIKWYLIHYSALSPVNIERGVHTMIGVADNITIPAVTLANAFPVNSTNNNAGNLNSASMIRYDLTTTTNMKIDSGTDRNQEIAWQVVDHPDYDVTKIVVTIPDLSLEGSTTVSAYDPTRVWIAGSYEYNPSGADGKDIAIWFSGSSTTVTVQRGDTVNIITATLYMVDGNNKFITQNVQNAILNTTTEEDTPLSPSIWTPNTIPFFTGVGNGLGSQNSGTEHEGADNLQVKLDMSSTTILGAERVGDLHQTRFAAQVIDFSPSI